MSNDVYKTVGDCSKCAINRAGLKRKRHFTLFLARGPLDLVPMDNLGPLQNKTSGNQFIVVVTYRYTKLTRAIPSLKTTALQVASIFFDCSVIPYGIPSRLSAHRQRLVVFEHSFRDAMRVPWRESPLNHCLSPANQRSGRLL